MMRSCRVLFLLLFTPELFAQATENFPPPAEAPVVYAIEATQPLSIDGRLTEEVWQRAPVIHDFFRMEPRQGGPVQYPTRVQVVFDKRNLYFGVFCADSSGISGIRVQDLRRDFVYGENDAVFIQLDPQNLKRFCFSFQTTPYGNQRDMQVFDGSFRDNEWDALWKVRTQITDSGYYAEFAIPFSSLRYDGKQSTDSISWGLTLARLARRDYEQTVFPAIPQSFDPYRMTYAARLTGLKLPPPSRNLRVQPYLLMQHDRATNSNNQRTKNTQVKSGGEIKWAVNPHAVLDLTFNTDFAQADVDRVVNNLTRFNVFFPERRQFFLENSGVYAGADNSSIKPFFSRAIGLSNTQFNAASVPIDAGARFTDRNTKRTLAGLYVHQRSTDDQAPANFGVFRYLRNYGQQNNVGLMVTHRLDEMDEAKGWSTRHNTTLTLDGLIRPNDEVTVQYVLSASRDNTPDSLGLAGSVYAGWFPNKAYLGWLTNFVSTRYKPGMGFVFGNNTIYHNPGGYYIWRPSKGWWSSWIRRWDPGVFLNWYQQADNGRTQELSLYIFPVYIITASNGQIEYALTPTWQRFPFSFDILGRTVPIGNYQYLRQFVRYETDASRKASLESKWEWGGYYNGRLTTLTLNGRLAPLPQMAFTLGYEHNRFHDFGTTKDDFVTDLWTTGIRLAINPRIQVSGFYQFNSLNDRGAWNLRGSWEFAPLSFVYLVFNEQSIAKTPIRNQSTIAKFSYLKQF